MFAVALELQGIVREKRLHKKDSHFDIAILRLVSIFSLEYSFLTLVEKELRCEAKSISCFESSTNSFADLMNLYQSPYSTLQTELLGFPSSKISLPPNPVYPMRAHPHAAASANGSPKPSGWPNDNKHKLF